MYYSLGPCYSAPPTQILHIHQLLWEGSKTLCIPGGHGWKHYQKVNHRGFYTETVTTNTSNYLTFWSVRARGPDGSGGRTGRPSLAPIKKLENIVARSGWGRVHESLYFLEKRSFSSILAISERSRPQKWIRLEILRRIDTVWGLSDQPKPISWQIYEKLRNAIKNANHRDSSVRRHIDPYKCPLPFLSFVEGFFDFSQLLFWHACILTRSSDQSVIWYKPSQKK